MLEAASRNVNWLLKLSRSDKERIQNNLQRLRDLRASVKDLSYFVVASQSGGYQVLQDILKQKVVLGNPKIYDSLHSALKGENNSKIALDSPMRFQGFMQNSMTVIDREIRRAEKELKELDEPSKPTQTGTKDRD